MLYIDVRIRTLSMTKLGYEREKLKPMLGKIIVGIHMLPEGVWPSVRSASDAASKTTTRKYAEGDNSLQKRDHTELLTVHARALQRQR